MTVQRPDFDWQARRAVASDSDDSGPSRKQMHSLVKTSARTILDSLGMLNFARRCACELHTLRQNLLTPEQISKIYGELYHANKYRTTEPSAPGSDWEPDEILKREHASAILQVLSLKRVLIGGCSSGMAVLAFRRLGVDAFGFEISPDLDRIVLTDVRPYVRHGSMTAIPFGAEDRFDAFITTDVLEHVQLKHVNKM